VVESLKNPKRHRLISKARIEMIATVIPITLDFKYSGKLSEERESV
jgi:hypothetical protein